MVQGKVVEMKSRIRFRVVYIDPWGFIVAEVYLPEGAAPADLYQPFRCVIGKVH